MDEYEAVKRLTNKELIHKLRYCKTMGKEHVQELKELVRISDIIKAEMKIRVSGLEMEIKVAEQHRENSDQPIFDQLLDLH